MKAEAIISLFVIIVVGLAIGVVLSGQSPLKSPVVKEETKQVEPVIITSNFTKLVTMGQNNCEGCHLSGKKFIPQAYEIKQHAEGTAYCLKCHTIDHNKHPVNNNVTCERCHGATNPQIPSIGEGSKLCGECHNYPDPLEPSDGNLIVIHRPRNVECTQCHIDSKGSCLMCHSEIKKNEKWDKRLNHFSAILKN